MQQALDTFSSVAAKPVKWLLGWKGQTGRKVIGCFPMYTPEEMVDAVGMLPVTLLGTDKPISLANQYLHVYLCHPVRANLELAAEGSLEHLDGLVFPDICDQVKRVSGLWEQHFAKPFFFHLMLPKRLDTPAARTYYLGELLRFKNALEDFSGQELTREALRQSITIFNEHRALLERLYQRRRGQPGLFPAPEVANILAASMVMPKEEHNALLSRYLAAREGGQPSDGDRPRVVVSGNFCEDLEPGLMALIEEVGAEVVDDDLYLGQRYFANRVPEGGDPFEALVEAHLQGIPCPTCHHPNRDIADYLLGVVQRSGAQGVIILLQKQCEIHAFHYPYLKQRLERASVPHLMIETDHSGASARIKTRLEAFTEMIRRE